ncbi:MAG: hypothetical protein DMG76_23635 [Acidobacteria bacterium]|nr:MAG: hypothetical protein DMG76_23635 [Acidobacteriota bacterium]
MNTYFVEIQRPNGEYFAFLVPSSGWLDVEKEAAAACAKRGARLVQIFDFDLWAICHLHPQEDPFNH